MFLICPHMNYEKRVCVTTKSRIQQINKNATKTSVFTDIMRLYW